MPILYKLLLGGVVLTAAVYWYNTEINKSYTDGYNAAVIEYEKASVGELRKDLSDVTRKLEHTLRVYVKEVVIASEKATELSQLTNKQFDRLKEYEGVIISPECDRLGDDFFRLYNQAIED